MSGFSHFMNRDSLSFTWSLVAIDIRLILTTFKITNLFKLAEPWIIERLDRKLMSRGLISNRRLAGSCFKMALTGSIIVEICDEMMAKMWRTPVEM